MLLVVAYGQRDPNAYFLQRHIKESFSRNVSDTMSLGDVFSWAHEALLRNLFGEFSGESCSLCQLFLQFYSNIIIIVLCCLHIITFEILLCLLLIYFEDVENGMSKIITLFRGVSFFRL